MLHFRSISLRWLTALLIMRGTLSVPRILIIQSFCSHFGEIYMPLLLMSGDCRLIRFAARFQGCVSAYHTNCEGDWHGTNFFGSFPYVCTCFNVSDIQSLKVSTKNWIVIYVQAKRWVGFMPVKFKPGPKMVL